MTDDHDRLGSSVAAYALGALGADDRRAFESHLAHCEICAAELAELAPLPGLLAKIDEGDVARAVDPARRGRVEAAARGELGALRRRARVSQAVASIGAAAAVVLAVVLVMSPGGGDGADGPVRRPAAVVASSASSADLAVLARGWGSEITLSITGLPTRTGYQLWTVGRDGTWTSAATWSPTPSGDLRLTGASSTATDDLVLIVVTSTERDDVLVEAAL